MHRLVLFAKRPRPGKVKTRLAAVVGERPALALYRAFLGDQLDFLRQFAGECDVEICVDGPWAPGPPRAASVATERVTLQGPGDLGGRLLRCFRRAWREGSTATVVIAADSPTLPADLVNQAFAALERGTPAVLAPARDGGYVLIGLGRPFAELFRDVPWGGPQVTRTTLDRARNAGIELAALDGWYDVDDAEGLRALIGELDGPAARARAPRTAEALSRLDSPPGSVV